MSVGKILELKNYLNSIDPNITKLFLSWALRNPRYIKSFIQLMNSYRHCKKLRDIELSDGVKVPPFLIISITSKCNLSCIGCYASATGMLSCGGLNDINQTKSSLNREQWRKIITEASELGVFSFLIGGGEPLLFPRLLELCEEFKDRLFIIATNGTAFTETDFKLLEHSSNIGIVVSLDGDEDHTDSRRGKGVYEITSNTIERLTKMGVITGISVTITRLNYRYWMKPKNIDRLISQGVLLAAFLEYIPVAKEEQNVSDGEKGMKKRLMLNQAEHEMFRKKMLNYRKTKPIYLLNTPGDELLHGGCLSAGRGFAHITPAGDLTPCPVCNTSTHNLATSNLREGLASALFTEIRERESLLGMKGIPCGLLSNKKEMKEIISTLNLHQQDDLE
ncbi:radical SAM/SPASM domain-containing protein [[Eubacterium] cellulosolvens]